MKFIWTEISVRSQGFGHGVEFYLIKDNGDREFVAFLDGYEGYHGSPETITIQIRYAAEIEDPETVDTVKQDIEKALLEKRLWQGKISDRIYAWLNG